MIWLRVLRRKPLIGTLTTFPSVPIRYNEVLIRGVSLIFET